MGHRRPKPSTSGTPLALALSVLITFGGKLRHFGAKQLFTLILHSPHAILGFSFLHLNSHKRRTQDMDTHGAGSYFVDEKAVLVENIFFDFLKRLAASFSFISTFQSPLPRQLLNNLYSVFASMGTLETLTTRPR